MALITTTITLCFNSYPNESKEGRGGGGEICEKFFLSRLVSRFSFLRHFCPVFRLLRHFYHLMRHFRHFLPFYETLYETLFLLMRHFLNFETLFSHF